MKSKIQMMNNKKQKIINRYLNQKLIIQVLKEIKNNNFRSVQKNINYLKSSHILYPISKFMISILNVLHKLNKNYKKVERKEMNI